MDVLPAVCSRAAASPGARRSGLGPADAIDHIGSVDIFADESDALQGRCPAWQGAGGVDTAGSRGAYAAARFQSRNSCCRLASRSWPGSFRLGASDLGATSSLCVAAAALLARSTRRAAASGSPNVGSPWSPAVESRYLRPPRRAKRRLLGRLKIVPAKIAARP